ncbi:MAG: acyl-CoA dehydrogenase family protein [Acidobacteriota bacterium]
MATLTADPATKTFIRGGMFLVAPATPGDVFTPEDFSEEHRMIAETTADFVENDVMPNVEAIEHKDFDLQVRLMRKAGELGLLSVEIPERWGGLGLDKASAMLVAEKLARLASFSVTHGGHTGIGTQPIVCFGTDAQKGTYLPKLATGELLSSYALTEAGSGSDALGAKATARLTDDGKFYVLNGEKMWITNAGFADIFITFAKIDGDKFSCFIVEKGDPGVSTGKEEKKMGIRGSSTRTLVLTDALIPADRLLGLAGKGHQVAFNILNMGRFKLGAGCIGGAKTCLKDALLYASQRHQFGRPIASFGAIKHKLGQMAIDTWVGESMVYRTAGLIDTRLATVDKDDPKSVMAGIEEYAVECSIIKVYASEMLDRVVDHGVQIYGGYGYSEEYPAERYYRDSRINRIFEGTNEINRMLIPGMLVKRAMRGDLPLMPATQKVLEEVLSFPELGGDEDEGVLAAEAKLAGNGKKVALLVAGSAFQKYRDKLSDEQEVLIGIADVVMEAYAMESAVLRAQKLAARNAASETILDAVRLFCVEATGRIEASARGVLAAIADGDTLRTQLAALRRFTKATPCNGVAIRRAVADRMLADGRSELL